MLNDRTVAVLSDAVVRRHFEALEVVLEDEVDDAGDGVRTVHGRGAAGDDVDAVDQAGRDRADVDHAGGRGGRDALAVDQDQGALRAETTKIEGREVFTALVVRRAGVARNDLRQFVEQGFDGDGSGQVELLRLTVVTGLGASRSGRTMREPVTTIASSLSACGFGASGNRLLAWPPAGFHSKARPGVCAAAGQRRNTPAPRSARACHPAVARKLDFLILISRIGAPFSATPLVRGRNPPPRGVRLASKGGVLSSALTRVVQLLLRQCDSAATVKSDARCPFSAPWRARLSAARLAAAST